MANEVNALLGRGSEFEGKLTFEGTVRIDGKFSGEIFSDDTLIIGEGARVKAEIEVANVILYGDVIGNIKATARVELHAPARLKGNISAAQLIIDQGVVFDGQCQMTSGAPPTGKGSAAPARTETPAPAPSKATTQPVAEIIQPSKSKIEPAIV